MIDSALAEYLKHTNEFHECLKKRTVNEIFSRGARFQTRTLTETVLFFRLTKLYLMPPSEAVKKRPAWRRFMKGKERSGADDCSGASDRAHQGKSLVSATVSVNMAAFTVTIPTPMNRR